MLNTFAKVLLIATSLAPLLGAVAVNQLSAGASPWTYGPWLVAAVVCVFWCCWILCYISKNGEKIKYKINQFDRNDKEMLTYLITYMIPFLAKEKMGFSGDWPTVAYVLLVIFLMIRHVGAYHVNPVMGLLGYHFYAVKNQHGVAHVLITRTELQRTGKELWTVRLAPTIYLETQDKDKND